MKNNIIEKYIHKSQIISEQPKLWIGDIYKTVDTNTFKTIFNDHAILDDYKFDKKELNEMVVLEWAQYLFENIFRFIKKAISNKEFISYSEIDESMPDFKIGKEYYEVTSKIDIFNNKKGDVPGVDFEKREMKNGLLNSTLDFDDPTNIFVNGSNQDGKKIIDIESIAFTRYKNAFKQINIKSNKKYNIEDTPLNIIFWFDRNIIDTTYINIIGIVKFVLSKDKKYFDDIFSKIKKIYFLGEDRRTYPKELQYNNPKYTAIGILFDKKHMEYILNNNEVDFRKVIGSKSSRNSYEIQEEIRKYETE